MPQYRCPTCGKVHGELPLDLAYAHPADYFKVPPPERENRIKCNDDICVIDESEFYIRGLLPMPIQGTDDEFGWGVWARILPDDFERYIALWDIDEEMALSTEPFIGLLSGGIGHYPGRDLLEVAIHLQANNQRPRFYTARDDSELAKAQRAGITMTQVHTFVEPMLEEG